MPPFFNISRKKSHASPQPPDEHPASPLRTPSPEKPSKDKKKSGYFTLRERDKGEKDPKSPRTNKSFSWNSSRRHDDDNPHPLNLPPDELRRLSALSTAMSSPRDSREGGVPVPVPPADQMETTPSPEEAAPGSYPTTNGVHDEDEERPTPPPHRTPTSPGPQPEKREPPQPEIREAEAEAFKAAGNKHYKAGQYGSAIDEYTKAIEANPTSSTYLSNRAAAYMAANRFVEALEDCKRADELEPNNAKVLHRLAKVYAALGRPQEALDVYDRIQPAATAKDRSPALTMQKHLSQAQESLDSSTSGSMALYALDQAEKGLGSTVQPPRKWRLMRGEAYLKMGTVNSLGDAQNVAMSLLRSNSADPEALVLRGRALYAQGENEKALQHFRQAISCDPDYKDAVKYLRMVQKLDKMKEEGNNHFKAARYQQAVDVYNSALEVDPTNKGTNSKYARWIALSHPELS